ncbi:MAG: DNA methyltransferase [Promethearchaeota archaeon]
MTVTDSDDIADYLKAFSYTTDLDAFLSTSPKHQTKVETIKINSQDIPIYINEFWTSKQRQASSIHEISYRACFKPQLPRFFIKLLTKENDIVYDPFSGRGTTVIEAGLLNRNIISNDINPLSEILSFPRFFVPKLSEVENRLSNIPINKNLRADIDLSMFYHPDTESEIISLKEYLRKRKEEGQEDSLDKWIRMIATNRLTGHSSGFFSVYTLPPNQAVTQESQIKINEKRNQKPEYRDTQSRILKKSKNLTRNLTKKQIENLRKTGEKAIFLTQNAQNTSKIEANSVQLTVTSPPFLNVVQYSKDNWLRCWFNSIETDEISKKITMTRTVEAWSLVMKDVFKELYRITRAGGWVAFEVGEVKKGTIKLEEYIVPLGLEAGFVCAGILINLQKFTKTSNIWGINNNQAGTNTNRIVLFHALNVG